MLSSTITAAISSLSCPPLSLTAEVGAGIWEPLTTFKLQALCTSQVASFPIYITSEHLSKRRYNLKTERRWSWPSFMRKFIILVFVTAHLHSVVQASRQVGVTSGLSSKDGLVWGRKWQRRLWRILNSDPPKIHSFYGLLLGNNPLNIWSVKGFIFCLLNNGDSFWTTLGQFLILLCTPWILTCRAICSHSKLQNIKAPGTFHNRKA